MSNRDRRSSPVGDQTEAFTTEDARKYGPSDPVIEEVQFDDTNPETGDEVEVNVKVRNKNTTSTGTSGYDLLALFVDSPQLDQHILCKCQVIGTEDTTWIDDSSSKDEGYDGEFPFTEAEMEIRVKAMGYRRRVACTRWNFSWTNEQAVENKDTRTEVLRGTGYGTTPPKPSIASVRMTGGTPTVGGRITVEAEVTNAGGPGTVPIRLGAGGPGDQLSVYATDEEWLEEGGRTTYSAEVRVPPAGGEWNHVGAYIPLSEDYMESPLEVSSPEFDDSVTVVRSGFEQDQATVGEEITYLVRVRNDSSFPWRVEATFTNEASGQEVGGDVIERLAPDKELTLASNVAVSAPRTTVCHTLTGQPVE